MYDDDPTGAAIGMAIAAVSGALAMVIIYGLFRLVQALV